MSHTILITGASSGIGRLTALELSAQDRFLVLSGRSAERLNSVAKECEARGALCETVIGDVTLNETIESLSQAVKRCPGEISVIHNAGRATIAEFTELTSKEIQQEIEIDLIAPMLLSHALLPEMLRRGSGQMIFVGSICSITAFSQMESYCAAKAGLLNFARAMAKSYRQKGIRIQSILPGSVDTPLWDEKSWKPEKESMLSAESVAKQIAMLWALPKDQVVEELLMMPPQGIL